MGTTIPHEIMANGGAIKDSTKNIPVFLFGSFTEDETLSLTTTPSKDNLNNTKKENRIQFGSVNVNLDVKTEIDLSHESLNHIPKCFAENGCVNNSNIKSCGKNATEEVVNDVSVINGEDAIVTQNSSLSTHPRNGEDVSVEHIDGFKNLSTTPVLSEVDSDDIEAPNGHLVSDVKLLPRGLINPGNLCFLNASLQALLSCSTFAELLLGYSNFHFSKATYPTLTAFTLFITKFTMQNGSSIMRNDDAGTGAPFCPMMFEAVIKKFTPDIQNSMSGRPRQEDAQEFLSFILNQLHDELLKLRGKISAIKDVQSSLICSSDDDEWEIVGRKNKSAVTRKQSFIPSELSAIFGGELRSVVTAAGSKASATIQPFLLLHLDIFPESVQTVEDALRLFTSTESLQGYRTLKSGKAGVGAKKCVKIQTPSKIMILHLMRFGYGKEGSTKLHKGVHFPLELTLSQNLFVSPSVEGRRYELVATITHHGKDPWKGHYTADARYPGNRWLRFDDSSLSVVGIDGVLQDQAYVLFYKQVV